MSASVKSDMEAKLKALECHFTWGIDKADIKDLDNIPEKLLDRIIKCGPPKYHTTYYNLLAFVTHLEGNNKLSLEYLHKAERAPKERQDGTELLVTYGNFAWVHYHSGNMDDVNAYLGKVTNICKGIPKTCSLPAVHGEKAWSCLRLGGTFYERAKESFQKALEAEPESASFNVGYAVALYRLEGMVRGRGVRAEEAVTQLRKALSLEPDNAEVMVLLALKLQKEKKDESKKLIKKALTLAPDVPHVTRYVAKYFRYEGSINESLEILGRAVEQSPKCSFLHHQIGLCHRQQLIQMKRGEWPPVSQLKAKTAECIQHFSKAVELKPSNIHAKVSLAEAYGDNHQLEEAMKIFTALVKDKSLRDSDRQHCLTSYGLFLLYKRKVEDSAVTQLKAAYQIPIQSSDKMKAGRKLREIAERKKAGKGEEILEFLSAEDRKQRLAEKDQDGCAKMDAVSTDELTSAFGKGMKLK